MILWPSALTNQYNSNTNQMSVFYDRGKQEYPGGEGDSRSCVENQQIHRTNYVGCGKSLEPRGTLVEGKCSHHGANTTPLLLHGWNKPGMQANVALVAF